MPESKSTIVDPIVTRSMKLLEGAGVIDPLMVGGSAGAVLDHVRDTLAVQPVTDDPALRLVVEAVSKFYFDGPQWKLPKEIRDRVVHSP